MKFLDPKVDVAFKRVLGNEDHKDLTKSFLNSILNLQKPQLIEDITFLQTELVPARIKGKKNYFDIYCTDAAKNHYIIEIQLLNEFNFIPRSEYYAARALSLQLKSGKNYQELLPVIFLGIVNYDLFDELDDDPTQVISTYSMHNDVTKKKLKKTRTSLRYIELTKFNKTLEELESVTDRWLYFFKHAHSFDAVPVQLKDLKKAFTALDELQWSSKDLQEYNQEEERVQRELRQQKGSKEEGVEETKKTTALNFLKLGIAIDTIVQGTGLSIAEIQELQLSSGKITAGKKKL